MTTTIPESSHMSRAKEPAKRKCRECGGKGYWESGRQPVTAPGSYGPLTIDRFRCRPCGGSGFIAALAQGERK